MPADITSPALGVVAGSGMELRDIFDVITAEIPFTQFPQLPPTTVDGHHGRFLEGWIGDQRAILQQGRFHLYEGLSMAEVVAPVKIMRAMGCQEFVFCNAAGGLFPILEPGELVSITQFEPWYCTRLPSQKTVHCKLMVEGCPLAGSYLWMSGPSYETRAEIRALQKIGHLVVGMSTLPEIRAAQRLGMPCAALSCVTNVCGDATPLSHTHVLEVARESSAALCRLLRAHAQTFGQ